jgi:hypothetical protein
MQAFYNLNIPVILLWKRFQEDFKNKYGFFCIPEQIWMANFNQRCSNFDQPMHALSYSAKKKP